MLSAHSSPHQHFVLVHQWVIPFPFKEKSSRDPGFVKSQRNPEASLKLEITMLCLAVGQSYLTAQAFQGSRGTNSCFQLIKMEQMNNARGVVLWDGGVPGNLVGVLAQQLYCGLKDKDS